MSQILIHEYLAELSRLKKASGSARESIVREAFKDLLKAWVTPIALPATKNVSSPCCPESHG